MESEEEASLEWVILILSTTARDIETGNREVEMPKSGTSIENPLIDNIKRARLR